MKKVISVLFCLLLLAACGSNQPSESTDSSAAETPPVYTEPWLQVDYGPADAAVDLVDNTEDYATPVIFSPCCPLKNFRYAEITAVETEDSIGYQLGEILHTIPDFSPDASFTVTMGWIGLFANRAVIFTAPDGTEVYYSVEVSGKDGSVYLLAFEPV